MSQGWHKSRTFAEVFRHAGDGVRHAFKNERNLRVQLVVYVVALLLGWWLQLSVLSLALVVLASGFIMSLELFNTAVEDLSNIINPTYHKGLQRVKDVAAGAVLVASITAIIIGLLLFGSALL
jgi:diacylglycerol kinase